MSSRLITTTTLAIVSLLTLSGCTRGTAPSAQGADAGLRLAETTEYSSLHPLDWPFGITSKFYDGLVEIGVDGVLEPGLAASMPTANDDLTTWTVPLVDGVTFSDGSDFDADDVVALYDAVRDPEVKSWLAADYELISEVRAEDPQTVVFDLNQPYAAFPSLLTLGIPAAEALGGAIETSSLARTPDGTGPYELVEWRDGESMTLAAKSDWWGGAIEVDRIDIAFVPDENARVQRLSAGDIDGAQLSPRAAEALGGTAGLDIVVNPSGDFRAISLPQGLPFFEDPQVRIALNLAVNRDELVEGLLEGHGQAISSPITSAQGEAYDAEVQFAFDAERAAEMLDEAGWVLGADGIRAKDNTPFAFTLMYFAEDSLRRDIAQAFASSMSQLGIQVKLKAVDRPTAIATMAENAFVLGGGDRPYDADTQVYRMLSSDFAEYDANDPYSNPSGYANADVDALLTQARTSTDSEARATLYRELQRQQVEDPAMVSLFSLEHTYIARDMEQWNGTASVVEPHEHGVSWGPWWNVEEWTR